MRRHQIGVTEELYDPTEQNDLPDEIQKFTPSINESSGVHGKIYEIVIRRNDETDLAELVRLTGVLGTNK